MKPLPFSPEKEEVRAPIMPNVLYHMGGNYVHYYMRWLLRGFIIFRKEIVIPQKVSRFYPLFDWEPSMIKDSFSI